MVRSGEKWSILLASMRAHHASVWFNYKFGKGDVFTVNPFGQEPTQSIYNYFSVNISPIQTDLQLLVTWMKKLSKIYRAFYCAFFFSTRIYKSKFLHHPHQIVYFIDKHVNMLRWGWITDNHVEMRQQSLKY